MHKTLGRPKNHGEISRNGVTYLWSVFGGLLSVTAPDGRQKRTQIGGHIKNTPLLYEFDDKLRNAGRSLAMRRKVMVHIKTCIKFAQGRGYVAQNVALGVKIKSDTREAAKGPLRPFRRWSNLTRSLTMRAAGCAPSL